MDYDQTSNEDTARYVGLVVQALELPPLEEGMIMYLMNQDVSIQGAVGSGIRTDEKAYLKAHPVLVDIRKKCDDEPEWKNDVTLAWASVTDAIYSRAAIAKVKPLSFDVHLEVEVSREAFIIALHRGKSPEEAKDIGINRGLPIDFEALLAPKVEVDAPTP